MFRSCCAAILAAIAFAGPASEASAQGANLQAIERICRTCHLDRFLSTARGPHSVLDTEEWRAHSDSGLSCTSCHGDVSEHMAAGGRGPVFAFQGESAVEQSGACLDCHRDTHPRFDSSPHATAGMTCTDCHSLHSSPDPFSSLIRETSVVHSGGALGTESALCTECHGDVLALFELNERHRLREGVLECVDCHNPHEPATRTMLGGIKQQLCTTCHADKGGPFVFEHPASRVEGCTACHSPHGSPNRHMLTNQRVGELCFTCHAAVPQFHLGFSPVGPPRFGLDTQCTNCHSAIHGSNFDPHLLR